MRATRACGFLRTPPTLSACRRRAWESTERIPRLYVPVKKSHLRTTFLSAHSHVAFFSRSVTRSRTKKTSASIASEDASTNTTSPAPFVSSYFELGDHEVASYLTRKKVSFKITQEHAILRECPSCPDHKGKADNMFKLYVSVHTGVYFCHRCKIKGSWFELKRLFGGSTEISSTQDVIGSSQQQSVPSADNLQELFASQMDALYSKEYAHVLEYLLKVRGLPKEILKKYRVGAGVYQFQNEDGEWEDHSCITFPWIIPKGKNKNYVARVKVRSYSAKQHQKIQPKGGAWGLFGWHTVPEKAEEIILTEGEFDAMAAHLQTGKPSVSLPNGASSLPVELLPMLEQFKKIYLWMDDDKPGREGATKFAKKLGVRRCFLVPTKDPTKDEATEPKDANDALLKGKDFNQLLERANRIPHQQIVRFEDLKAELYQEMTNPVITKGIKTQSFPKFDRILKGHRKGEFTIFTGPTGVGKTTLLSQITMELCKAGVSTLWGSFETKNVQLVKKMIKQYFQRDYDQIVQNWNQYSSEFSNLPLYFLGFFGSSAVDDVLDAMEYAVYVCDVEHIVLDNLQFMLSGQGSGYSKFDVQDRAIEAFREFATTKNVHVTLVIHPRKQEDDAPLTTASVFGTAKATQEADNVIIIQRGNDKKYLDIRKNRFDGDIGTVPVMFDRATERFYEALEEDKKSK